MSTTEILIPFQLDVHGNVATTSDPDVQQMQHVESIVKTYPGERVMIPQYGIPLRDYLFESGPAFVTNEMQQVVMSQMAMWEPSIQITNITPVLDDVTEGVVSLNVDFVSGVNATPSTVSTAVVYVGGNVVES